MPLFEGSSAESSSSQECEDIHFIKPPLGPLSAFDLFEDHLVFFEEKYNRLMVVNQIDQETSTYTVPTEYEFGKFYWAATCTFLDKSLTDISIDGYQIWSQRAQVPHTFHYSFSSKKIKKKSAKEKKKLTKSVSDRALFREQMAQAIEAESTSIETKSLQPIVSHRRTTSTESASTMLNVPRLRSSEEDSSATEVVMLEATVTDGRILHRVLSVGKKAVRVRLSGSGKRRALGDSVRIKQTTRFSAPPSPTFKGPSSTASTPPILIAGQAVFINKHSPSEALIIPVKEGITNSLLGALAERIRKPSSSRRISPTLHHLGGHPPPSSEGAVWSDFHVEEGKGACVAIQDEHSSEVSMWMLHVTSQTPLRMEWRRENSLPISVMSERVSEMRLSMSPDNKACLRGNRFSSETSDEVSPFCMTFDRIKLAVNFTMSPKRGRRKRKNDSDQSDHSDNEETLPERINEISQSLLAAHSGKGIKDNEVRKLIKDAPQLAGKNIKEVLGCKLIKDTDHLFLSYDKSLPKAAQGNADLFADAKQGLLSIVLIFIHMSKNPLVKTDKVKEHDLWEFLNMLEVVQFTPHPVFGLPSKLIGPTNAAEFISQGWLSFEKKKGERHEADEIFYDWGPRAFAVINPKEILETFCEIVGDKPEEWREHFRLYRKMDQTSSRTTRMNSPLLMSP
uniref:Mage-1 n=1 Tax=Pristionchus pacificus TaxID=54126 RepID=A0A2A6BEV4_PRIPA|eukprot:PDM64412.1 mage-1 [Pristionchus pacificus]